MKKTPDTVHEAADRATLRDTAADRRNTHRTGPPGSRLLHTRNPGAWLPEGLASLTDK